MRTPIFSVAARPETDMDIPLPSRSALKAQAKRLRVSLAAKGKTLTHAESLEAIAHQWGARDWNTLVAQALDVPQRDFTPGAAIRGRYLGNDFSGRVKAARLNGDGSWTLSLRFDEAMDVVTSPRFSAWRQQITCTVDKNGRCRRTTSDGRPHVELAQSWEYETGRQAGRI